MCCSILELAGGVIRSVFHLYFLAALFLAGLIGLALILGR